MLKNVRTSHTTHTAHTTHAAHHGERVQSLIAWGNLSSIAVLVVHLVVEVLVAASVQARADDGRWESVETVHATSAHTHAHAHTRAHRQREWVDTAATLSATHKSLHASAEALRQANTGSLNIIIILESHLKTVFYDIM